MNAKAVIKYMKDHKAVAVDMKFNDFLGIWQHFTIPVSEMSEAVFEEGLGFDGSSIRGWQPIHASDMLVMPDPSSNGYLAFAAMLMAGLDGIQKRLSPGEPLDKDIYALTPEELKEVPSMPASLDEALANLKNDHEFLLQGDVFTEDVIETWIEYKMANEVSAMRLRPHPHEFALYFDV